jgi:hypothetical protein
VRDGRLRSEAMTGRPAGTNMPRDRADLRDPSQAKHSETRRDRWVSRATLRTRNAGRRVPWLLLVPILLTSVVLAQSSVARKFPDLPSAVGASGPSIPPSSSNPADPSARPTPSQGQAAPTVPASLVGRGWIAEIDPGIWTVGSIGGPTVVLPANEVALAAASGWIISAFKTEAGDNIAWRHAGADTSSSLPIRLIPASVAIFGDSAYLSGFDRASGGDPGVLRLELSTGKLEELMAPSEIKAPRSVAISPSGLTLVSATCADAQAGCALDVLDLTAGTRRHIDSVPGYLRSTGDTAAVVGPDPATWVAAIDVQTGKELWRRGADEMWAGYVTSGGDLVQASLSYAVSGSVFAVDVIALTTGSATNAVTTGTASPVGLWPEVSSDDTLVIGPGFDIGDALANLRGKEVLADLYDFGGRTIAGQLRIGGN